MKFLFWGLVSIYLSYLTTRGITLGESLSYFVIRDGWSETIYRAITYQGQSPLYFLFLYLWKSVFGSSEVALRLPSIFLFFTSLKLFELFVRQLKIPYPEISRDVLCLLMLLSSEGILLQARPYALAMSCFLLSLYSIAKYLTNPSKIYWLLLHVITVTVTIYSVYLFALGTSVILIFIFLRSEHVNTRSRVVFAYALTLPLYLPVLSQLQTISNKRADWNYLQNVGLWDLLFPSNLLFPLMGIATYLLIGNLKCLINQLRQKDNKLNFLLAIFWLFLPNILALSVQIVFGISIASNKYLIWGLPGIALFGSLAYPNTFQLRGRITALFCAIIYSVLSNLYGFSPESWRTQAEWITTKKKENVGCVLVYSGLVESYGNSFHSSSELSEYLVSPIRYYLPNDTLLPLPLIGWDAQTLDFTKNFKSKAKSCSKQIFVAIGGTPAITNSSGQKVEIFEVISSALDTHGFKVNSSAENTERDRTIEFISSGREN